MAESSSVSVADFGAVGDGLGDDAPAFQAALDAGPARVVVPYGTYRLGSGLRIGSGRHLLVHPSAWLRFAEGAGAGPDDFVLTNADHASGNRDIRIEGGVWDGNAPGNPRGPDAPGSHTGVMLNFTGVAGLTLRGMTLVDSESYFVRLGRVRDFLIEDIAFDIKHLRPNQDGIHVSGHCEDGIIRRIRGMGLFTPNDDMVALVADDALQRAQNQNGAFNGPIRRIRVEHLRAASCHSFLRLLSVDNPIEEIEISDVAGGCHCSAINLDACRECRVQLFAEADRPDGVGAIRNVRASDFSVFKAAARSHQPLIDFRTRADAVRIERFERDTARDACPEAPTVTVEKAGTLAVTLEGFEAHALQGAPSETMNDPQSGTSTLSTQRIGMHDALTLQNGGFSVLEIVSFGD